MPNEPDTNLSVGSAEAQVDVNERVQETAFNDASLVENSESTTPFSGMSRFDELSSIIAFLERPALLWQSRIDSTVVALNPASSISSLSISQTPVKTFNFPSDLMAAGNKFAKIQHFEWFKADVKLRILINANPFVAGRLWITYSPVDQSAFNTIQPYARIENKGRVGITSYPGVELDLQTSTAAEILIPWIAKADAERASIEYQKLFRVDIWALTPLLVADNSQKIPIQVFGSFQNIELKFPTPILYPPPTLPRLSFQGKKEARGPISEIASKISGVASMVKDVPLVGSIASKAGWVSDIVGGVASVFGWSRPIEGSNAMPVVQIPGRGMSQFKAADSSVVLGMANDNEICEETQNFISDVDEMSVAHVCSRPGLVDVIDWNVSNDYNSVLGKYTASRETQAPNYKDTSMAADRPTRARDPTLAEYVMQNFRMYKADFTYRISLVKTAFHVGRFEVFFIPAYTSENIPGDVSQLDSTNCYRQIFDITEQNEMTFTVPYFHKFAMLRPEYNTNSTLPSVGTLIIRVVSPLTCPDTVSQSIKILVWKSASNVALAYPEPDINRPFLTLPPAPAPPKAKLPNLHFQINVTNEPKGTDYLVFDQTNSPQDSLSASSSVAGEICTNLREATRAFRPSSSTLKSMDNTCDLRNNIDYHSGGYLAMCSMIYYFFRGGLNYKILNFTGSTLFSSLLMNDEFQTPRNAPPFHITPKENIVHEVSVPFYSQTRRRTCSSIVRDDFGIDRDAAFVRLSVSPQQPLDESNLQVFMGGKDDLTFGFLVGCPLMSGDIYLPQ